MTSSSLGIEQALITNPNIKLIRTSRTACAPHDQDSKDVYDLVVIYKSAPYHFEERRRILEAYRNLPGRIRVVFALEQLRADVAGNLFHMNGGFDIRLPENVGAKAGEWARRATEARERVLAEADEFGDMIIGDYVDTYVNLTFKLIMSHRWASAFCQDVLMELVVAEAYTRFLYVDDAFMGFAVAKLPHLRFHSLKGFYLDSTNNQSALIAKSPLRF
ncbi:unnamed protein product [Mesocestoides corti]|uniref:Hexosyltransferase n=2 Tax=Mesocestoides corti TaxID=53468 RepID=A0A3P6I0F7_MESCO|nr:unnamed protein product [Mesocestoides corti]